MTTPPDLLPDEPLRLQALRKLNAVETPLDERFERLTRLAQRSIDADIVAISLVEADRQYFKSIQGLDVCETSRDVSFCAHAILQEGPMVVPDAREDERFKSNPLVTGAPGIVSYASAPIVTTDGHKVGSLCAIHTSKREFTFEELQTLEDLANLASVELQAAAASAVHASLLEDVSAEQRKALVDPLTRMWNRTGILEFAHEAIMKRHADAHGIGLVLIDLDRFKRVNDTLGHAAGDEVLRAVSRRMLATLRETDAVGRIGGDEFLCVLSPCESPDAAVMVANRLRERVVKSPIRTDSGTIQVTASFGVHYVACDDDCELDELIELADRAMYECKHTGRDGVSVIGQHSHAA